MGPSEAEVARTLLQGRLPGTLEVGGAAPARVCHSTDAAGRPLVLLRDSEPVPRVMAAAAGGPDPRVLLAVADLPPVAGAPSRGRARLAGRMHRLDEAGAATAVHEFAAVNPAADLLDVGRGTSLYQIEVDQVWLDRRRSTRDIPVAEYTVAEPDPLHDLERDLLLDLAHHHAPQVAAYFRFLLAVAGVPCCGGAPRAVRLDRYGFVVDPAEPAREPEAARRWVRLQFHRPVRCRHELAYVLQPVLFHGGRCPRRYR